MSTHHWWTGDDGYPEEITDRIDINAWELRENAEEGSSAMSTITVDDPDMIHDYLGHRAYWVTEDLSDEVIFYGFIADQTISHGDYAIGRQWRLSVADINSILFKRVMTGINSNRPAETDVERLTWLITTHEGHAFDNTAAYISTASPVDMDAHDYRGEMASQIISDCAQQSGNNWYAKWFDGTGIDLVYGPSNGTSYPATLLLSNDPADLDLSAIAAGTATTWPISDDTTMTRDPSRVFSGAYVPYNGGAVYRQKLATATYFTWYRDCIQPATDVNTYATAVARAQGYLDRLGEQDLRITTSVILPAALVNEIRPGMSLYLTATHLPGAETSTHCRVLSRSVKVWAIDQYQLTLELSPITTPPGIVQVATSQNPLGAVTVTLDVPAVAGDLLVAFAWGRVGIGGGTGSVYDDLGGPVWTALGASPVPVDYYSGNDSLVGFYKIADGGEQVIQTAPSSSGNKGASAVIEIAGAAIGTSIVNHGDSGAGGIMDWTTGDLGATYPMVLGAMIVNCDDISHDYAGTASTPGTVEVFDGTIDMNYHPGFWFGYCANTNVIAGTWNHWPQAYAMLGVGIT